MLLSTVTRRGYQIHGVGDTIWRGWEIVLWTYRREASAHKHEPSGQPLKVSQEVLVLHFNYANLIFEDEILLKIQNRGWR